jgi:hypothetical protein
MTLIIVAVVGWVLFLLAGLLYLLGNHFNSKESLSLAAFALGLILSEPFLEANRDGICKAVRDAKPLGLQPEDLGWRLIKAVTATASRHWTRTDGTDSLAIVIAALKSSDQDGSETPGQRT